MNNTEMRRNAPIAYTNHFAWEIISDNAWKGQPCFIVGGGPSLEKFNWDLLKGKLTIGINRAYEKFDPNIIFGMDPKFVRWILMGKYGDRARMKFLDAPGLKIWLNTKGEHIPGNVYILKCWSNYAQARAAFPFTMKDGIGHGNNSGYAALNFAACLGANPIYLLGYDMKKKGDRSHWHEGHPEAMPDHVPNIYKKNFVPAAKALMRANVKVINLNPDSGLDCFPKQAASTVLRPDLVDPRAVAKFGPIAEPGREADPVPEDKATELFIVGPGGFGDTLYCRSVVKSLAKRYQTIYVRTSLPEAFWDIDNVKFIRPVTQLRAQQNHIRDLDEDKAHKWTELRPGIKRLTWGSFVCPWQHTGGDAVTTNPRGEESTTKFLVNENNIKDFDFSFPIKKEWIKEAQEILDELDLKGKKICIVRPPTIHKEWANYSRNPKPEYFQLLVDRYKDDYFFITVSNNKKGEEWFEGGELKGIDKRYDHGELSLTALFGMVKLSAMVITPPDFFSVLSIAIKAKCFCIFGGCAKPDAIFDENMGLDNFRWAAPEPFCNCMRMEHDCNKKMGEKDVVTKFEALRKTQKYMNYTLVALPPGIGDMHWVLAILESFKEKNHIDKLNIAIVDRGVGHQYSSEFLNLVPFVDGIKLMSRIPFTFSIMGGDGEPLRKNIQGRGNNSNGPMNIDYLIEFNSRLEHGIRIEDVLPKYDVDFDYPIKYPEDSKQFAKFIKKGAGNKLYLFYASSHLGNNNWCRGIWDPKDWVSLAEKIYAETKRKPILIGAEWDKVYSEELKKADPKNMIHNLVGKTNLPEMLALLREANCVVSFLSGITMLATRFKTPCVSFWPTLKLAPHWHDPKKFQKSWIPPNAEKDGYYMPFFYGEKNTTPTGIFDAIRKYL